LSGLDDGMDLRASGFESSVVERRSGMICRT
jgi:hypothetical protein